MCDAVIVGVNTIKKGNAAIINDNTMNSVWSGFDPKAFEFWQYCTGLQDFIIDASTAYSWTSREEKFDKKYGGGFSGDKRDRPGNDYQTDVWDMGEVASGRGYSNGWFTRGTKGSPSGFVSNTHYERGQPSRGIWLGDNSDDDNSCYMDLMWTGMGEGSEDGWRNKPFAEKLQENNSGIYGNARNFIERFCTPGTKFRFRKDRLPTKNFFARRYRGSIRVYRNEYYVFTRI